MKNHKNKAIRALLAATITFGIAAGAFAGANCYKNSDCDPITYADCTGDIAKAGNPDPNGYKNSGRLCGKSTIVAGNTCGPNGVSTRSCSE